MKNALARLCPLLLALLLVFSSAMAETDPYPLKRGSRGDEVMILQQLLYDLGFLDEEPDGIFGGNTEKAVKAWQRYRGAKQTGRMSEETMSVLDDTWVHVEGIASEANATKAELKKWFGLYCSPFIEKGRTHFDYCYRHYRLIGLVDLLSVKGAPAKMELKLAERISSLWLKDIRDMYASWEKSAAKSKRSGIRKQLQEFENTLKEKRAAWQKGVTKKDPNYAIVQEALWLNEYGAGLCFDLYGAEKN